MSKYELDENYVNYRSRFPNVRGGWTKQKIQRELKKVSGKNSELLFYKEIAKYDTPEDFASNLFYHGSGTPISDLKPSIVLKDTGGFGGGYEDKYYAISLSADRNMASNFTGNSHSGSVAPVLIRKFANIKHLPDITDACELEDIIEDLWAKGIDAVVIGDHNSKGSEQEVCILNPTCIIVGKPKHFNVFNKPKMPSFSKYELETIWLESSEKYKSLALESWDNSNENFKTKYGRPKAPETRWTERQNAIYKYHKNNVIEYQKSTLKQTKSVPLKQENKSKRTPKIKI